MPDQPAQAAAPALEFPILIGDVGGTNARFAVVADAQAGAGEPIIVQTADFATIDEAIRKVVGGAQVRQGKVKLDIPPLIDNGNTVPLSVAVESPMTAAEP